MLNRRSAIKAFAAGVAAVFGLQAVKASPTATFRNWFEGRIDGVRMTPIRPVEWQKRLSRPEIQVGEISRQRIQSWEWDDANHECRPVVDYMEYECVGAPVEVGNYWRVPMVKLKQRRLSQEEVVSGFYASLFNEGRIEIDDIRRMELL